MTLSTVHIDNLTGKSQRCGYLILYKISVQIHESQKILLQMITNLKNNLNNFNILPNSMYTSMNRSQWLRKTDPFPFKQ